MRRAQVRSIVAGVLLVGVIAGAVMAQGGTNAPGSVPPGFDRPLVIDRKLERDVQDLQQRVKALEALVEKLQKQVETLQGAKGEAAPKR